MYVYPGKQFFIVDEDVCWQAVVHFDVPQGRSCVVGSECHLQGWGDYPDYGLATSRSVGYQNGNGTPAVGVQERSRTRKELQLSEIGYRHIKVPSSPAEFVE
jgi:hypothetical protein